MMLLTGEVNFGDITDDVSEVILAADEKFITRFYEGKFLDEVNYDRMEIPGDYMGTPGVLIKYHELTNYAIAGKTHHISLLHF